MKTKFFTGAILVIFVIYIGATFAAAWRLIVSGEPIAATMGVAVLVIPLLGVLILVREIRFGATTQAMANELKEQGLLPVDDLPRTPSGRIVRAAADEDFKKYQAEAEAAPERWQSWHRLALAYDASGDRKRARSSMRHAIKLRREERARANG